MTNSNPSPLIDESEIRDALRVMRTDRDAFESQVRARVATQLSDAGNPERQEDANFLQVAASFMPWPLLAGSKSTNAAASLAKVPFGSKVLGAIAIPATSLLLSIGAFGLAAYRMRKVNAQACDPDANPRHAMEATNAWWRKHWLVAIAALIASYVLPVFAVPVPFLLIYLLSAVAMVSMLTTLARQGLVTRQPIGSSCCMGLIFLVQLMNFNNMFDISTHLIDQSVVTTVLLFGALLVILLTVKGAKPRAELGIAGHPALPAIALALVLVPVGLWFSYSLLRPMNERRVKQFVESFDEARFSSASWDEWSIPAKWLVDSDQPFDPSKPQKLLEGYFNHQLSHSIVASAFAGGIVRAEDVTRMEDFQQDVERLVGEDAQKRPADPLHSIGHIEYAIRFMLLEGSLTDPDRDLLESRTLAWLDYVLAGEYDSIDEVLRVVRLLEAIDRPIDQKLHGERIRQYLVDLQRNQYRSGSRRGGFAATSRLEHTDLHATASAIELMQHFGISSEIDMPRLRSFLRPEFSDRVNVPVGAMRTAARARLDHLVDAPPVTWWDYVRYEQNLWCAAMLVLLCLYATWISPLEKKKALQPIQPVGS